MLKGATIHFYYLFDDSTFFKHLCYNYVIMECIPLNWLYKYMKKVRSRQAAIFVLNWVKHSFSLRVSSTSRRTTVSFVKQFSSDITWILPDFFPMSNANNQICTVAIFHSVKSRLSCVLQFFSRLLPLHEILFQKTLEMVLDTIVQYYTLIFILNIGRRVGCCCFGNQQGLF